MEKSFDFFEFSQYDYALEDATVDAHIDGCAPLQDRSIASGKKMKGYLIWEVPADRAGMEVFCWPFFSFGTTLDFVVIPEDVSE